MYLACLCLSLVLTFICKGHLWSVSWCVCVPQHMNWLWQSWKKFPEVSDSETYLYISTCILLVPQCPWYIPRKRVYSFEWVETGVYSVSIWNLGFSGNLYMQDTRIFSVMALKCTHISLESIAKARSEYQAARTLFCRITPIQVPF